MFLLAHVLNDERFCISTIHTVKFLIKAPQKINFDIQIDAQLKRKKMISAQLAHCLEWRLVIGTES